MLLGRATDVTTFFNVIKSSMIAPAPMRERAIAPDIKIDLFKIFILASMDITLMISRDRSKRKPFQK